MKKIIVIFLLCKGIFVTAQTDTTTIKIIELPNSTGFGKPDGSIESKEIGITGGRIVSSDGRVELIFPAGALSTNLKISIQPTTNLLDSAAGKAYQFEPSGTQFKKPVQVIFHYNDQENETCPADLMSFAMQDKTGKWTPLEYDTWDSTAKTLKGYIHHFSNFTNLFDLVLEPVNPDYHLRVGETTYIMVNNIKIRHEEGDPRGSHPMANLRTGGKWEWFANGVGGGNVYEGTIENSVFSIIGEKTTNLTGMYVAPWFLPKKNPVKISLSVRYYSKKAKDFRWATCHTAMAIWDSYNVSVVHEATGREGMDAKITDKAEFLVTIKPKFTGVKHRVEISKIKNYSPTIIRHGKNGIFREKIMTDDAVGSIDIIDEIAIDSLSSDYPPEVYFEFKPRKILWHTAEYTVRGTTTEKVPILSYAIPFEVNFIANSLPQSYNVQTGSKEKWKLIVSPEKK